jgi:hypothetical protein
LTLLLSRPPLAQPLTYSTKLQIMRHAQLYIQVRHKHISMCMHTQKDGEHKGVAATPIGPMNVVPLRVYPEGIP